MGIARAIARVRSLHAASRRRGLRRMNARAGAPPTLPIRGKRLDKEKAPAIEVAFPDLDRWAKGNTGIPYVTTHAASKAGPHVLLQALTHGNEVCGAIALDWLLHEGFRPTRGTVT